MRFAILAAFAALLGPPAAMAGVEAPPAIDRSELKLPAPIILAQSCRLVSERVICGQDCYNVRLPSGDGRTYVTQRVCNPRYCTRQRRVCN